MIGLSSTGISVCILWRLVDILRWSGGSSYVDLVGVPRGCPSGVDGIILWIFWEIHRVTLIRIGRKQLLVSVTGKFQCDPKVFRWASAPWGKWDSFFFKKNDPKNYMMSQLRLSFNGAPSLFFFRAFLRSWHFFYQRFSLGGDFLESLCKCFGMSHVWKFTGWRLNHLHTQCRSSTCVVLVLALVVMSVVMVIEFWRTLPAVSIPSLITSLIYFLKVL